MPAKEIPAKAAELIKTGQTYSLGITIDSESWTPDPLFRLIQERGNVAEAEMRRTFNMGVGFTMVIDSARSADLIQALQDAGEDAFVLGEVTDGSGVSFST